MRTAIIETKEETGVDLENEDCVELAVYKNELNGIARAFYWCDLGEKVRLPHAFQIVMPVKHYG